MEIFEVLFYQPIFNAVVVFYRLLGDNLGLSIIAIALLARTIMIPLTLRQTKLAETGKEFNEKSAEIKKKHKKDKKKQQEELMKLQQEYLPAQLGGCLPLIVQFIIFINIYNVIRKLIDNEVVESFNNLAYSFVPKFEVDYQINTDFFGLDLARSASNVTEFPEMIPYLLLVVAVGIAQFFSFKLITAIRNRRVEDKEGKEKSKKKKSKADKKKKDGEPEDFAEIMQRSTKQTMYLLPIFLMFISYTLPSGLSIYLITTTSFVILQQLIWAEYRKRKVTLDNEK